MKLKTNSSRTSLATRYTVEYSRSAQVANVTELATRYSFEFQLHLAINN